MQQDERGAILRLLSLAAMTLGAMASLIRAEERKVDSDLIAQISRFESNYSRCAVDFSTLHWRVDDVPKLETMVSSTVLQWDQFWWQGDSSKVFATSDDVTTHRFAWRQPDSKYAIYTPPDQIEVFREKQMSLRPFQPYSNLLQTLGFEGTVSEFLKGDAESLNELRVSIVTDASSERLLAVKGVRSLPGSRHFQQVFELHLSIEQHYLPVWGRYYEVKDGVSHSLIETVVTPLKHEQSGDESRDLAMALELRTTRFAAGKESRPRSMDVVTVQGQRLEHEPDRTHFGPPVFVGGSIRRYFEDGAAILENPYQPTRKKSSRSYSPFVIWLIVNDVLAIGLAANLGIRRIWRRSASSTSRRRALAHESRVSTTDPETKGGEVEAGLAQDQFDAISSVDPATAFSDRFPDACAKSLWSKSHLISLFVLADFACLAAGYGAIVLFTVVILSLSLGLFLAVVFRFVVVMISICLERRRETVKACATESDKRIDLPTKLALAQDLLSHEEFPIYTILVPLYREANIAASIIRSLSRLDYPRSRLDIKLLLEHDDPQSLQAVLSCDLGSEYEVITVPPGLTKTKPRACDYGLVRARGEFTVIFDAEDRPEPDQLLKAVALFRTVPADVACLQAKLNYFNPRDNFLTRSFALEYTAWFDLVLPGLQVVNAPVPLGGTSNHFRTSVLQQLGGWDPYNVTEDCDLGVRIAVNNYRTMIIDSTTWEEANSELGNWIRQRSRWVKGYLQTHLVHTKRPYQLFRQLGFMRTLYFLLTVGGVAAIQLLYPILWLSLFVYFGLLMVDLAEGRSLWVVVAGSRDEYRVAWKMLFWGSGENPIWASVSLVAFITSIMMFLANGLFIAMNLLACRRRRYHDLWLTALLSPIYWSLASIAAWKGALQLITKPHFWEKTRHGLNVSDPTLNS